MTTRPNCRPILIALPFSPIWGAWLSASDPIDWEDRIERVSASENCYKGVVMRRKAFTRTEVLSIMAICTTIIGIGLLGWFGCCSLKTFDKMLIGFTLTSLIGCVIAYRRQHR